MLSLILGNLSTRGHRLLGLPSLMVPWPCLARLTSPELNMPLWGLMSCISKDLASSRQSSTCPHGLDGLHFDRSAL